MKNVLEYTKGCGYHRAWGRAKDNLNYDKKAWIHCQAECELEFEGFRQRIAELERQLDEVQNALLGSGGPDLENHDGSTNQEK